MAVQIHLSMVPTEGSVSDDLIPFTYGAATVRVVMIGGEPWFVLADLCAVLGLAQFRRDRLADDVIRNHPIEDRLGRLQPTAVVSEPGMYEVVIRSDKPEAVKFRRWITGEVLPETVAVVQVLDVRSRGRSIRTVSAGPAKRPALVAYSSRSIAGLRRLVRSPYCNGLPVQARR